MFLESMKKYVSTTEDPSQESDELPTTDEQEEFNKGFEDWNQTAFPSPDSMEEDELEILLDDMYKDSNEPVESSFKSATPELSGAPDSFMDPAGMKLALSKMDEDKKRRPLLKKSSFTSLARLTQENVDVLAANVDNLQKMDALLEDFITALSIIEKRLRSIKESTLPGQWAKKFQNKHPLSQVWKLKAIVDDMITFHKDFTEENTQEAVSADPETVVPAVPGHTAGGMTAEGFQRYEEKAKKMSEEELSFALKDLREVIDVQESSVRQGGYHPKIGFYWDEYWIYLDELNKRHKKTRDLSEMKQKPAKPVPQTPETDKKPLPDRKPPLPTKEEVQEAKPMPMVPESAAEECDCYTDEELAMM